VDERLSAQVPADVSVYPVQYPLGRACGFFRYFAQNGVWLPRAWRAVRYIVAQSRPDAVLTSGPPQCVHVLGLWSKQRYGLPWAADFRDPWVVGDRQETWRSFRVWCARRCERAILRHADLVVANAPRAGGRLQTGYPEQRDKIVVVTNGFDPGHFARRPARPHFEIVHTGEVYYGRDPRPFLDAVRATSLAGIPLRARFLGRATGGNLNLEGEVRGRGLGELVESGGQVSYDASRRAMANADILLLLDTPRRKVGVPAKLYEYLGAGAAILALTEEDSDATWVLRESGVLHRIAPPCDPQRIGQAIAELTACLRSGHVVCPTPERLAAFTRESAARELASHLDHVLAREETFSQTANRHTSGQRERRTAPSLALRAGENDLL
jgi:glycosyltransferase involved in cell wall biosynthesis